MKIRAPNPSWHMDEMERNTGLEVVLWILSELGIACMESPAFSMPEHHYGASTTRRKVLVAVRDANTGRPRVASQTNKKFAYLCMCRSPGDESSLCHGGVEAMIWCPGRTEARFVHPTRHRGRACLGGLRAMRGHHHETCPRRATKQGELLVDTSRAPRQRVTARVQLFRGLNFRLACTFVNHQGAFGMHAAPD